MIFRRMAIAAAILASCSAPAIASDVENAYKLGEAIKRAGFATEYDVSGWGSELDIHISSVLPGDARDVANATCQFGRENMVWQSPWTVRVFLVVGDRPAATCTVR